MKITLIIPAKNESESLPKVLDELKNLMSPEEYTEQCNKEQG